MKSSDDPTIHAELPIPVCRWLHACAQHTCYRMTTRQRMGWRSSSCKPRVLTRTCGAFGSTSTATASGNAEIIKLFVAGLT